MSLRIGLVTGEFPPMEGGVGAFTQELARALAAAGHEVHIITDRQARPQAVGRRPLRELFEPVDIGFARLHPRVRRWRWPSLATIADIALRHELDVVNVQYQAAAYNMRSPAINFLPWRLRGVTRTVVTFHDLRVPYLFPKAGRLRRAAVNFMARRAHGVIVTNTADFHNLSPRFPHPIRQIPIGSNIQAHPRDEKVVSAVRAGLGLAPSDCLLGYFGFLNPSKGADVLLEALAQLDGRTHLVFIGGRTGASDPDNNQAFERWMRGMIEQLGLVHRVHWTGFLDDAAVSAHLHAADMLVLPYRDGVSLRRGTLMAALAHGCPVITTQPAVPAPELRHGGNVYCVPANDVGALAGAIRAVAADHTLRAGLGEGAAQVAGAFSWDKIAAQTADFFHELLGSGRQDAVP
ncbi:MAG: glycosyltransferase family 4 protein [Anaerolineae bacterium]